MHLPTKKVKDRLFPFIGENNIYEDSSRAAQLVLERPLPFLEANM